MLDENTRWAPPEEVVRLARESGFSTTEIVRIVSGALSHPEARQVAAEHPHCWGSP